MTPEESNLELALFERVKELTCLYAIARLANEAAQSPDQTLQRIVELLPSGWRFPEAAEARITVDGRCFSTPGFRPGFPGLRAEIVADHEACVEVLVVYREPTPEGDEGPFLNEERNLLNAVAGELGLIVERSRAERDRSTLTQQLHHADRLATLGQLAAGVAHELNEPLAAILGFAQLSLKSPDLPEPVARDLDRIVQAALHARGVIRNLLLFARRVPSEKSAVRLNALVEDALTLLESRFAAAGIEVIRSLDPGLAEVTADTSQMRQVLVNLLVNAVQAMPAGGRIDVRTRGEAGHVVVEVADRGTGIAENVRRRLFTPFFTTKDVGEGTGLGLAVASGIVSSHGGTIRVESEPGQGSRFEVRLPLTPPDTSDDEPLR